jgi:hypothetical protein
MRGAAPITPDPKKHMKASAGHQSIFHSWFEAEARAKDFKHNDIASPMFMPGIIKESPRPAMHHHYPMQNGNYNITVNYNDFGGRKSNPVHSMHPEAKTTEKLTLDLESMRERFNIDQQKSNKVTPRESQVDKAEAADTSLQKNFSITDVNFASDSGNARNLSFMKKIADKNLIEMSINQS